jgi:dTMP kinase
MANGVWIALEGGDGSGKSTQARLLALSLDAVLTREPGATPIGSRIREILLDPSLGTLDARAESLLLAADRAQHLTDVVAPALAAGRVVVSDRSAWSALAYQGYGRGLDLDELRQISDWAMQGRWPDLAVLVDVPSDVAESRVAARGDTDRFDGESDDFRARVRTGFVALAAAAPETWVVIDGVGSPEEVSSRVISAVRDRVALDG